MAPFTRRGATAAVFDGPDTPVISAMAIAYIDGFATERTGAHDNPHMTTGFEQEAFVRTMVAEPSPAFEFNLTGASIFTSASSARRIVVSGPGRRDGAAKGSTDMTFYPTRRALGGQGGPAAAPGRRRRIDDTDSALPSRSAPRNGGLRAAGWR
jgi:hypothetical protein